MTRPYDPPCPVCGHLASYHDVHPRECVGRRGFRGVALPGDQQCMCQRPPDEIPGWSAFHGKGKP